MFERYTEQARRSIFFARWEASLVGSPYIESEHLLLGILREGRFPSLIRPELVESIRQELGAKPRGPKFSTSVDLPLSHQGKRALQHAADEADTLNWRHIGIEHLLLGLLREGDCVGAQLLIKRGVTLVAAREWLKSGAARPVETGLEPAKPYGLIIEASSGRELSRFPVGSSEFVFHFGEELAFGKLVYRIESIRHVFRGEERDPLPEEIAQALERLKFIMRRMESAISSHEFEKARFYSDEERKERDTLHVLCEKHHLDMAKLFAQGPEAPPHLIEVRVVAVKRKPS